MASGCPEARTRIDAAGLSMTQGASALQGATTTGSPAHSTGAPEAVTRALPGIGVHELPCAQTSTDAAVRTGLPIR